MTSDAPDAGDLPEVAPAPHAVMQAYPWDLYSHGPEAALDELRACGVDAVQLSFSYHVASFLTPRQPAGRVRAGEPGAIQFDPSVLGSAWPVEPVVAPYVTGPGYVAGLLEAAAERELRVTAWVVYLYNHALASRRPDLAVENAYGDRHGAQLCPANPLVRQYVRSLTEAVLSHEQLTGVFVESLSYLPYDYGLLNLKAAVRPGAESALLLGLCFCEHCRGRARAAGVEAEGLRRAVARAVDHELSRLPDGAGAGDEARALVEQGGDLRAYLDVRAGTAGSLQREVLQAARSRGLRTATNAAERQDPRVTGVTAEAIGALRTDYRFEALPGCDDRRRDEAVAAARAAAGPSATVYALAQLGSFPDERSFVSSLAALSERGVRRFRFYEFGLLSRRQLAWLRGAKGLWAGQS